MNVLLWVVQAGNATHSAAAKSVGRLHRRRNAGIAVDVAKGVPYFLRGSVHWSVDLAGS
jgi:hypothetical protein